ncbi:hypothetical protein ACFOSD_03495 [Salinispirillum marinum]|uniref:MSHA biogenesis protein MshI n=2 Tax=Saccharospirillaceae TaxID=255527 RepID=A0ABV8BDV3_9GAMM
MLKPKIRRAAQVGCYRLDQHVFLASGSLKQRYTLQALHQHVAPAHDWRALQAMAVELGLTDADWHWVLPPEQYQIRLLDVPNVPEEEMKDALAFRVRDMISMPLEEAVVDTCLLPADAFKGRERKAFAIVAHREPVERLVQQFGRAGLRLASIDVADMALRNLLVLAAQSSSSALLRMRENDSTLNMVYETDLCLNRALSQGTRMFDVDEPATQGLSLVGDDDLEREALALELQRSLDYFDNQLGLGSVRELFVVPDSELDPALYTYLSQRFGVRVTAFQWHDGMDIDDALAELPLDAFAEAIGGTLRWLRG